MIFLADFRPLRPRYETLQSDALEWLAQAHTKANPQTHLEKERRRFDHYGCGSDSISKRGHEVFEFLDSGFGERTVFYLERANEAFRKIYDEPSVSVPDELIHVTCTGYTAPSAAQRWVANQGWEKKTTVTHAYHMGCLASLPAVRMAQGSIAASQQANFQVDIVHIELCSIHFNPALCEPKDYVAQSLFSDGMIRYSALSREKFEASGRHGLEIIGIENEIVPHSSEAMTWNPEDWGMRMHLSAEIPELISNAIPSFLDRLFSRAGLALHDEHDSSIFAIHPGGPKIVELFSRSLSLRYDQVRHSTQILFEFGNMSSATLPHIWDRILTDPDIRPGQLIVSLAFGPGLTLYGSLARKRCSSSSSR